MQDNSTRQCRKCGEIKQVDEFDTYDNGRGQRFRRRCKTCRRAAWRAINPKIIRPIATHKTCCECKQELPVSEYYLVTRESGNKRRQARCILCVKLVTKAYRATPQGRAKKRAQRIKAQYGLSGHAYAKLLRSQGNACAICKKPETYGANSGGTRKLGIDHVHDESQKVRGLLCAACNRAIGLFKDDPELLIAAANYLRKHQNASKTL